MRRILLVFLSIMLLVCCLSVPLGVTINAQENQKTIYLTFDDGPCFLTKEILDILDKNNIKATFFVVGQEAEKHPEIIKRIHKEGHTIGIHCYTHDYKIIYENAESFKKDIESCRLAITKIIPDIKLKYMRFAGGSFGLSKTFIDAAKETGLINIDWNAVNGDTDKSILTAEQAEITAFSTASKRQKVVLLMHDNKSITAKALQGVINKFKDNNYIFKAF